MANKHCGIREDLSRYNWQIAVRSASSKTTPALLTWRGGMVKAGDAYRELVGTIMAALDPGSAMGQSRPTLVNLLFHPPGNWMSYGGSTKPVRIASRAST